MSQPKASHWKTSTRILKYIFGTHQFGLEYNQTYKLILKGHINVDWVGCQDTRHSTSGYYFDMNIVVILWSYKKQPNIAFSSMKVEYKVVVYVIIELIQLRRIPSNLGLQQLTILYYDNQSVLKMLKNLIFYVRSKHIEVHHHLIHEYVQNEEVNLIYHLIEDQVINIFTKSLSKPKFKWF